MGVKLGLSPYEKNRLRVLSKVLSRIFRPKKEKSTEGGRQLRNEELHNLHLYQIFVC
jgi:hypothetical protein